MTDPVSYYAVAKNYIQSAYIMMTNPARLSAKSDAIFTLPFHLICGFAFEIYMKSYLMNAGYSHKDLTKNAIRHDLVALCSRSAEFGFNVIGADQLATVLNKHHKSFGFRYIKKENEYDLLNLQLAFSIFSDVDNAVDAAVEASASRGGSAGGIWVLPPEFSEWRDCM